MPQGIETVDHGDGFVTVDFIDRSLRGPALQKLIETGGPEIVKVNTRGGPRRTYTMPLGNAHEAGLIDVVADGAPDLSGEQQQAQHLEVWLTAERAWKAEQAGLNTLTDNTPAVGKDVPGADAPSAIVGEQPSSEQPVVEPVPEGYDDMRAYARKHDIDLGTNRSKIDIRAAIEAELAARATREAVE